MNFGNLVERMHSAGRCGGYLWDTSGICGDPGSEPIGREQICDPKGNGEDTGVRLKHKRKRGRSVRKQNHWKRNQKIAVLAAGSLLAQCVGVGIPVRAEIKHVEVSEGMTWERATASDASVLLDDGARIDGEKATLEKATPAQAERIASISLLASPGNLWENWPETMDFPGDGTEEAPYQINSLSRLLGFSRSVAEGNSYEGQFFELTRDLDLGGLNLNHGSWNPIGWYQNAEEMDGEITCGFRGTFDGAGHTIKGLKIADASRKLVNAGLAGLTEESSKIWRSRQRISVEKGIWVF